MKTLREIFTNPVAITFVILHWLVFFYAIIFENTRWSSSIIFPRSDYAYQWLESLNVIPLTIIEVTGTFLDSMIGMNLFLNILLIIFALFIVNFQWLLIGYWFGKLFLHKETNNFVELK